SNVKSRLNSYQTADPERSYKLEYAHLTPYFREIEAYIHEKYENKHEWVKGTLEDIKKDIKGFV
ncbi:MAG: GIY-YIG nuclease family protein, partial [Ekhidna sp.]|nr:GIY-YIG nuclease family protein [Ekhidna sp.]